METMKSVVSMVQDAISMIGTKPKTERGSSPWHQTRRREDLPRLRPQHLPEGGQEPGHRLAHQEGNQVPQGRLRRLGGRDPEEGLPLHRRLPGRPVQAGRVRRDQGEPHSQPGLNRGDDHQGPRGKDHRHLWQTDHPEVRHDQAGGGPPQATRPHPGREGTRLEAEDEAGGRAGEGVRVGGAQDSVLVITPACRQGPAGCVSDRGNPMVYLEVTKSLGRAKLTANEAHSKERRVSDG